MSYNLEEALFYRKVGLGARPSILNLVYAKQEYYLIITISIRLIRLD